MNLEYEWDAENLAHIARHDVSTEEVEFALDGETLDLGLQDWHDEERFSEMGVTARGRFIVVVTTWRGKRIRVVTAYDAPREYIKAYYEH
jgi:uncharacterized DUF497 family protein